MARWIAVIIVSLAFAAATQAAPASIALTNPMVADISQSSIEIRSDFNGTELLIFGARTVPGDLVIAVRGPSINASLRRKERIAGMWMQVDSRHYEQLPIFYAIATTKPINRIASPTVLQSLGLGERRIIAASNPTPDEQFDKALTQLMARKQWWHPPFSDITYFGESLFKARLSLPDTLPSGNYTVEVYLFNRGKLIGFQHIPLQSYQSGLDADIALTAKHNGLLYGVMAIAMALFGGWLAHRLFHR